jgi:integral membrane sensor domain MASE1/two-component sensor histidine kinase
MWPEGLPAHSQNALWLASGVNVAGLLLLGLRYWPVILFDAFPAHWIAREPLDLTILGSGTNALEAVLAAWMIHKFGAFDGEMDRLRSTGMLLLASLLAPLMNTLIIPAYFCLSGAMTWANYGQALGNWNLANGTAMLMLVPVILSMVRAEKAKRDRWMEKAALLAMGAVICGLAFCGLFSGAGDNLAFLVFPVVIYASVRFGPWEVSAVFLIVLLAIYGALACYARKIPGEEMASAIWFAQAFCWVLAATGLLVTALMTERRQVEKIAGEERSRALEASLREERARLDTLRYQINPHFLFNALNSLRATLPDSAETSREMVTELARYFRSTLEHSDADMAPLHVELRSVEDYLAIEQRRFGSALQVSLNVADEVEKVPIPIFLVQPLVENAIRHGFKSTKGIFEIRIKAHRKDQRLFIEVANTGAWKDPDGQPGLGLENIRQRLKLLYQEEAVFQRIEQEGWVCFQIELPLSGPKHHALPDR